LVLSYIQTYASCWTNMRTQVKRTQIENPDAF
jgi:hypothetical protein